MSEPREETQLDEDLAPPANMPWLRHKISGYKVILSNDEVKHLRAKGALTVYKLIKPQPSGPATIEYRIDKGKRRIPRITTYAVWQDRWTGKKGEAVYRGGITGTLRWVGEGWYDYHSLPMKTREPRLQKVAGYVADGRVPTLPYHLRRPGEMPFWASRTICRVERFGVKYRLGKYYWMFVLRIVKSREVSMDSGIASV